MCGRCRLTALSLARASVSVRVGIVGAVRGYGVVARCVVVTGAPATLWRQVNYNWFTLPIAEETVQVTITGFTQDCALPQSSQLFRVDQNHTSTLDAWVAMGSPTYPTPVQIAQLQDLSSLRAEALALTPVTTGGSYGVTFTVDLLPLSVAMVSLNRC